MKKLRSVLLIIFWGALFLSEVESSAYATSDEEIRNSIRQILSQRHPVDNKDWWQSLGSNAPRVIVSMYNESHNIYHKIRLIDALSWFDDSDATQLLKQEAQENSNRVIKNSAIKSLTISQGMKENEFVSGFLSNPDPLVRSETAKALSHVEDPNAQHEVDEFIGHEKNDTALSVVNRHRARQVQNQRLLKKSAKPI